MSTTRRKGFVHFELRRPGGEEERDQAAPGWRCGCGAKVALKQACLACEPYRAPPVQGTTASVGRTPAKLTGPIAAVLGRLQSGHHRIAELTEALGLNQKQVAYALKRLSELSYAMRPPGTLCWTTTGRGAAALEAERKEPAA